jgi:predicted ABC-type ATPase
MVYVAAGPVDEHIRRVANRADLGQHSASEAKIRDIYEKSIWNLVNAFHESRARRIELLQVFDNYLDANVPEWLEIALDGSDFNIPDIHKALASKR